MKPSIWNAHLWIRAKRPLEQDLRIKEERKKSPRSKRIYCQNLIREFFIWPATSPASLMESVSRKPIASPRPTSLWSRDSLALNLSVEKDTSFISQLVSCLQAVLASLVLRLQLRVPTIRIMMIQMTRTKLGVPNAWHSLEIVKKLQNIMGLPYRANSLDLLLLGALKVDIWSKLATQGD